MHSQIPVSLLRPHPRNEEYFSSLSPEKHEEVKRSIESHGIRDPLKILPDYTVIAGHQRLKIALELGLEKAPVTVVDISPEEAEYLLIADNEERRQEDGDPVKKAKRAAFLKQYWGVREGRPSKLGQNVPVKSMADVADAIGEDERTAKRLLKLNDLIPELQALVSSGALPQTAAYSLAFLLPDEQKILLHSLGDSGVCGLSVREAQALRTELDRSRAEKEKLLAKLAALEKERNARNTQSDQKALANLRQQLENKQAETDALQAELAELARNPTETEKIVYKPDPAYKMLVDKTSKELTAANTRLKTLAKEKAELESRLSQTRPDPTAQELEGLKAEIERLQAEKRVLTWENERGRSANTFGIFARKLFAPLEKYESDFIEEIRQTVLIGFHREEARRWINMLQRYQDLLKDALRPAEDQREGVIIDMFPLDSAGTYGKRQ